MPFDILVFLSLTLSQWRIAVLLLRMMDRWPRRWRVAGRCAIVLLDVTLAAGYLCTFSDPVSRLPISPQRAQVFGAYTLTYLVISTGVLVLASILNALRKRVDRGLNPGRRQVLGAMGNVVLASPFVAMGYGFVHRTDFHVREVEVPIPGLADDLDGLRILQLSDIHLSAFLSEADLARVIDASLELRPHLAVVTGDLISHRGDPIDDCIRQLARLKADAGVFGCMGNHERYARAEDYTEQAAARKGIRFLRGASVPLRFGKADLNLVGVDHQAKDRPYLQGAERLITPGSCNVLLSHNPDVFPVAARQGYNFVLAGHTHGGQVTVEILDQAINPARFYTPYVYGLYRAGGSAAYVTRGIGTIGIPARIGATPEISLLRLRKA